MAALVGGASWGSVTAGSAVASGGKSHSAVRPTSSGPLPMANRISVAPGASEMMRMRSVSYPPLSEEMGFQMMESIAGGDDVVTLRGVVPSVRPEELFRWWTEPELLTRFWADEAEVEPSVGGSYSFSWPGPGWRLRGS